MAVAGKAGVDQIEIGVGRILKADTVGAQLVDSRENIVGCQREVLDSLAFVRAEKFLDLAVLVLAFVERDAYFVVGCGHRFAEQPGRLTLDVEIADLAEAEDAFVELGPVRHPPAIDVVGEVIERVKANRAVIDRRSGRTEVDVVDFVLARLIDEVQVRPADALDRGDIKFHRPDRTRHRRRPALGRDR